MNFFLFTDLVGSTKHALTLPQNAEQLRIKMIEVTLEQMRLNGGTACQYTGDGFLCLLPSLEASLAAGEAIIRTMGTQGAEIRVAVHHAPNVPADIRQLAQDASNLDAAGLFKGRVLGTVYFNSTTYTDCARCARLLGVTCGDQILVTEEAHAFAAGSQLRSTWKTDHPHILLKDFPSPERPYEYLWAGTTKGRPGSVYLQEYYSRIGTLYIERPQLQNDISAALLEAKEHHSKRPLVVIHGEGGMGKTRLAGEVALAVAARFRARVWISIANTVVRDSDLMDRLAEPEADQLRAERMPDLANQLRVTLATEMGFWAAIEARLNDGGNLKESFEFCFQQFVRERPQGLLVLDNWEPLEPRPGDPREAEACLELLHDLVRWAPEWSFLLTSRTMPRSTAEIAAFNLDAGLRPEEAREFVQERWRLHAGNSADANLSDAQADALAHECGYWPLAIELVTATKSKNAHLSAEAVIEELKAKSALDVDPETFLADDEAGRARHRTMRASQEFSYAFLSEREKKAFRTAAVFSGPWTLAAGSAVLEDNGELHISLRAASRFCEREREVGALTVREYDMHRVTREFARHKLTEPEREHANERLIAWAKEFLSEIRPERFDELEANEEAWTDALLAAAWSEEDWVLTKMEELQDYSSATGRLEHLLFEVNLGALPALTAGWLWLQRGDLYSRLGENEKALAAWAEAETHYCQSGSTLGLGNVAYSRGDLHSRLGENDKALAAWAEAETHYCQSGSPLGLGNVAYSRGDLHSRLGENEKALAAWAEAETCYRQSGSLQGLGNLARSRGDLRYRLGENEQALAAWAEAETYFRQSGDPAGLGDVARSRGDLHFRLGENEQALAAWAEAETFFRQSGSLHGLGNVARSRGDLHSRLGENEKALAAWAEAETHYRPSGSPLGLGNVAYSRGDLHSRLGENDKAMAAWAEAETCYRQSGDPLGLGTVANCRGDLYARLGENDKAMASWAEAETYYCQSGSPLGRGNVAYSRGDLYSRLGENEKALAAWAEAETCYRQSGSLQGLGNLARSRGDLRYRIGENEKALLAWEEAESYYRQSGDPQGRGGVARSRGDLLFREGRILEAQAAYHQARAVYEEVGDQKNLETIQALLQVFLLPGGCLRIASSIGKAIRIFRKRKDVGLTNR